MGSHGDTVERGKPCPSEGAVATQLQLITTICECTNLNKFTDFFFSREARNLDFFVKVLAQFLKIALWEQIKHFKVDYGPGTISL